MLKIENVDIYGWEAAIRGTRNPMNSWEKSDSRYVFVEEKHSEIDGKEGYVNIMQYLIGPNDHDLMMRLVRGGPVEAKFRRMFIVTCDILAPLYWWKEFDTYKVGTVANSCSTMHKIHAKEFSREDFSLEHLCDMNLRLIDTVIQSLNLYRAEFIETKNKEDWWQMIQLLPTSYNQRRTVQLSYEVLANIYPHRKNHKLDEWREFCEWIEGLPYSEFIIGDKNEEDHHVSARL